MASQKQSTNQTNGQTQQQQFSQIIPSTQLQSVILQDPIQPPPYQLAANQGNMAYYVNQVQPS